jgi:hypothetical protein
MKEGKCSENETKKPRRNGDHASATRKQARCEGCGSQIEEGELSDFQGLCDYCTACWEKFMDEPVRD